MADKVRAVMVGCGGISGTWLEAAKAVDDLEIVGLIDINEDSAKARKEQFGLASAATGTDLAAMLDAVKPDAVFDCTVPDAHVGVTLTALGRGCHVLGEKPLADSMENARKMVEAAGKAGRIYAVIQNRRYQPEIRALRAFLEAGRIGELTTLCSDFFIGAHFGGFRDRMEHVLILDMAIHTFDAARFISGADPVAVYCKEWNPSGSWYDHDASAVAVFEMTNGLIYTYRGSWCSEGLNTSWESSWRVIGTDGSASWDGAEGFAAQTVAERTGSFISKCRDEAVEAVETEKVGGHAGILKEFTRCVRTGETPETICTDNIKSLAMVFGCIKSAQTGTRVEIGV